MSAFKYEGFTKSGRSVKGVKEALSRQQALVQLTAEGVLISSIAPASIKPKGVFAGIFKARKNLADIYFQLALLLRSGIPLVDAINIIIRSSKNAAERETLIDVASKVSEGMRFSDALDKHSGYFEPMYVNLVKASERIGRLSDVLMDIAEYEETKSENTDKLVSAMIYPAVVLIMGFGVLGFLMAVIVPKMQGIFSAVKQELPASTKLLLAAADFSKEFGGFLILLFVFIIFALQYIYRNNNKFRMNIDRYLFRSNLAAQSAVARFVYILAFQLREGLPLADSLYFATKTVRNSYMRSILEDAREKVLSGVKFSTALKNAGVFPELFPAAAAIGESSGTLPELLGRVHLFYTKRIDKFISGALSIVSPLFIVIVGALVAFVVISIMLPLLSMSSLVE
ncbi:MAG: type II secretion system F family protein [Deferribacteraceae bacterium]|jgi:type II secretory pathway component PulF|nr:type II secretion system F family protein [Deferribacteraceae bacterium]